MKNTICLFLIGLMFTGCADYSHIKPLVFTREYIDSEGDGIFESQTAPFIVRDTFCIRPTNDFYNTQRNTWRAPKTGYRKWEQIELADPMTVYDVRDEDDHGLPYFTITLNIQSLYLSRDKTRLYRYTKPVTYWKRIN